MTSFFSSLSPHGRACMISAAYMTASISATSFSWSTVRRAISDIDIAVSKDSNPNYGRYFTSLNASLTINN
jgi:hypothetical protein